MLRPGSLVLKAVSKLDGQTICGVSGLRLYWNWSIRNPRSKDLTAYQSQLDLRLTDKEARIIIGTRAAFFIQLLGVVDLIILLLV